MALTKIGATLGGSADVITVTQSSHGLYLGYPVKMTSSGYAHATADTAANAEAVGIVIATDRTGDNTTFSLALGGRVTVDGCVPNLATGTVLFLQVSAGLLAAVEPSGNTQVSKPMAVITIANSEMIMVQQRGEVISTAGITLADESVDSDHYVDGSIDSAHIGNDQIDSQHYAATSIDNEHLADNAVDTAEIAADAVTNAKLANMAANTVKVNATTGSANPTDISMASANLSGAIADGDVLLIYDASTTSLKTVAKSVLVAGIGGDFSNNGDAGPLTLGTTDSTSLTLETNNTARMVIASGGQITMPTQPAFCAYLTANATNVTGNGAVYIMGAAGDAGGGMTEDFDRGGNFSTSTFKFVAPVAGIYFFHAQAYVAGFASSPYVIAPAVRIYKGNTDWGFGGTVDTAGDMISSGRVRVSLMLELAVDDEITARITATNGGSNLVDVQGGSSPRSTWFMGYLVA